MGDPPAYHDATLMSVKGNNLRADGLDLVAISKAVFIEDDPVEAHLEPWRAGYLQTLLALQLAPRKGPVRMKGDGRACRTGDAALVEATYEPRVWVRDGPFAQGAASF